MTFTVRVANTMERVESRKDHHIVEELTDGHKYTQRTTLRLTKAEAFAIYEQMKDYFDEA